jgi:GcrA cell cycle regulator
MSTTWDDQKIHELVRLWLTTSIGQLARRLRKSRSAISGKVGRLIEQGRIERGVRKHYEVPPVRTTPPRRARQLGTIPQLKSAPAKPPPPPPSIVSTVLSMKPCQLIDLDRSRCCWPLGELRAVAVQFCGGVTAPGKRYCAHHVRMAARD